MADNAQPLNSRVPIVNKDGTPSDFFIRWAQRFSGKVAGQDGLDALLHRQITAGTGLTGGGDLTADREFALDASLGDLNDVDLATTPPADQQVIVFDQASSKWVPADQSGGGGGGGGGTGWTFHSVTTAGDAFINLPLTGKAYEIVIRGQFVATGDYIALRWSNDGGATWISGASDYKDASSNSTSRAQLIGVASGAGREFVSQFKLTGLNQARKASLTGTASASNSSGSLTSGAIAAYDSSNTQNINAIRIYSNGGTTMDDVVVMVREIAEGSGGGSSVPWWFDPPKAADFTMFSGDANALPLIDDADEGLLLNSAAVPTGITRGGYITLTDPTKDWDLAAKISMMFLNQNYNSVILFVGDSVSDRGAGLMNANNTGIDVFRANSLGTWNADYQKTSINGGVLVEWYRIRKVGSNIIFSVSNNGKIWVDYYTLAELSYMTNHPNRVGFAISSSALKSVANIQRWSLTGPGV